MKVNSRVKYVFISEAGLLLAGLWLLVMMSYLIVHPEERMIESVPNGLVLFFALAVFSIIVLAATFVWAELYHQSIDYLFGEKELVVEKGIIGRKKTTVPYDRIKEVRVLRSGIHLIDQIFGVATLRIETGEKKSGEITIPGIIDPEETIRAMMNRTHVAKPQEQQQTPASAEAAPIASDKKLLFEILEELKAIRKSLENSGRKEEQKASAAAKEPAREFMDGIAIDDQVRIDELTRMLSQKKKKK